MPGFDVTIGHYTLIPNPFWGGVLFPLVVFGVLVAIPWVERRLTHDHGVPQPRSSGRATPRSGRRSAWRFFTWVLLIFIFGAADRVYVLFGLSYGASSTIFRVAHLGRCRFVLFIIVRRGCRGLQAADRIDAGRRRAEEEAERVAANEHPCRGVTSLAHSRGSRATRP